MTDKNKIEKEIKEKEDQLIALTNAISEHKKKLKAITGMLAICSNCDSVRDSEGNWHRLEKYLESRSTAQCSHSICPDCAKLLYPGIKV